MPEAGLELAEYSTKRQRPTIRPSPGQTNKVFQKEGGGLRDKSVVLPFMAIEHDHRKRLKWI